MKAVAKEAGPLSTRSNSIMHNFCVYPVQASAIFSRRFTGRRGFPLFHSAVDLSRVPRSLHPAARWSINALLRYRLALIVRYNSGERNFSRRNRGTSCWV